MDKEELNKLNESIKHCEDVISNLKLKENCDECLKQHEQLKKWLIEYKNLINPQPYKLEDLKVGMWVYDIIWEECFEICEIFPKDNEIHVLIHKNRINVKRYEPIKFEEGRFFPVTKSMEYKK